VFSPTMRTSLRSSKSTTRASLPVSIVPFWLRSVRSVNEDALVIVTRDMWSQTVARRFTESNLALSRLTLNSRAIFCLSKFVPAEPNCDTAMVTKMMITVSTIISSMMVLPLSAWGIGFFMARV